MRSPTEHLFVYGTLREQIDHPMSDLLQRYARRLGQAEFQGKLFDGGSYPVAVASDNKSDIIQGELYKIKNSGSLFSHLDPYEGYDPQHPSESLFLRQNVTVLISDKETDAWIYLYNRPVQKLTRIPGGDYISYLKK